jgi:GNAT superfamily N-acetyltransferase
LHTFPIGKVFHTPDALLQRDVILRNATMRDINFLCCLYYQSRAAELAAVAWSEADKKTFLDSQFDLQHHHYLTYYAEANFLIIEHQSMPIGRFYLLQQEDTFLVVDISLVSEWRNQGIGSILIRYAQKLAQEAQAALQLHVEQRNQAAYRLYQRLGFVHIGVEGSHIKMHWPSNATSLLSLN